MTDLHIDRCQCFGVHFAKLREIAEATGAASIEELQNEITFGQRCKLCHPYVRRMLQTGEVVFRGIVDRGDSYTGDS